MDLDLQFLFFFSALGVFNGFFVALYFLFFIQPKLLSNYFFGLLITMLCIRIGKSIFYYFFEELPKIYLQIGLSACFFIGPFLLFYVRSVLNKQEKFTAKTKWHILLLIIIIVSVGLILPYPNRPDIWNQYIVKSIYFQWMIYILFTGFLLKGVFQKTIASTLSIIEKWLLIVYITNVIIYLTYLSALFFSSASYILGPLSFSFFFYGLIGFVLFHPKRKVLFFAPPVKYFNKKIEQEKAKILIEELKETVLRKKLYQNSKLKLQDAAEELAISGHQLSQLLNDNLGKSFAVFINEYRIVSACEMMASNDHLTLEGIGYEVGFSSKSTFYATFKKVKGITPAQYKKQFL